MSEEDIDMMNLINDMRERIFQNFSNIQQQQGGEGSVNDFLSEQLSQFGLDGLFINTTLAFYIRV